MDYDQNQSSVKDYLKLTEDISGAALIKILAKHLKKEANLLELGSGPGNDWRILSRDYKVIGSDYSEHFLAHLKAQNPQGTFLHLDASTLKVAASFDAIYSNKVLQHLDAQQLIGSLQRQYAILNPQGIICHSFWHGTGQEDFKGMLVNYQDEESLKEWLEGRFTLLYLERYREFEDGDSILLIARRLE